MAGALRKTVGALLRLGAGLPGPVARLFTSFDVNTANGGLSGVTQDFRKLTGKDPVRFADWLKANAAAFAG